MKKHFIKNLSFQNFKCFESIEVDNLKRVNIFGGKNNVGKTSLLEGIELFVSSLDSVNLYENIYNLLSRRQYKTDRRTNFELDFMYKDSTKTTLSIDNNNITIQYLEYTKEKRESFF